MSMGKQLEFRAHCAPEVLRERLTRGIERENALLDQWYPVDSGSAAWKIRFKLTWRGDRFTLSRWESVKDEGAYAGMGHDILCGKGRATARSGIHFGYGWGWQGTLCNPFRGRISIDETGSIIRGRFTMSWPARGTIWGMALLSLCLSMWCDPKLALLGIALCVYHGVRGELQADQMKGCDHILQILETHIDHLEEADQ